MTKYYMFRGSTGTAQMVTDDRTGAKLPKHPVGAWIFSRELELKPGGHSPGGSHDDIIAAIAKDGYYQWPHPEPSEEKAKTPPT